MTKKFTAQCACGACKLEFDTAPAFIANCHCLDCKRASGGEMATFFGAAEQGFALLSGTPKAFQYVSDSGKKLERNFCPDCGSRLYTSNLETFPGMVFVMLGSLVEPGGVKPALEMFTKRRLAWVEPLDIPQFPGMPG